jgi:hypothetical protein
MSKPPRDILPRSATSFDETASAWMSAVGNFEPFASWHPGVLFDHELRAPHRRPDGTMREYLGMAAFC